MSLHVALTVFEKTHAMNHAKNACKRKITHQRGETILINKSNGMKTITMMTKRPCIWYQL